MNVLMFSRDPKILEEGSAVYARMIEYGTLFDELHVVILNKRFKIYDVRFKNATISKNVWVYSTNSNNIFFALFNAYKIGKQILNHKSKILNQKWTVTSQDSFETGYIAAKVSQKFNLPLQIQIHTDFLSPYFKKESIKNFIRYYVAKIVLPRASCVRVVSERIKNSIVGTSDVHKDIRCPVTVLPIFIDAPKIKNATLKPPPKKFDFTVLWIGRLEKEKNCSLAISAFAQFVRKYPSAGLVIIGDGKQRGALESRIKNYELSNNVVMLGWQNDVAGYYKSADVLLATSWYEGYGLTMVEARVAGIPVVAPDIGVAREIGAYIAESTQDSLARKLEEVYQRALPRPNPYLYPHENKGEYLKLYKESFLSCLSKEEKT